MSERMLPCAFAFTPLGARGRALFGSLGDSAPDRWGHELMRRQWRREQAAGAASTSLAERIEGGL